MTQPSKRHRVLKRFVALCFLILLIVVSTGLLRHPSTPLEPRWNPFEPLDVTAPLTPLTRWKLDWAASDPDLCVQVLDAAARIDPLPDFVDGPNCGMAPRVAVSALGPARMTRVETQCATALRLAMWAHHGVQPAARTHLGSDVTQIHHIGSYNCRPIRGSTSRWSTHATAAAIDITGVDLADGRRIRLLQDWDGADAEAQFLRQSRDAACLWFGTVLGPDFNRLHADHFHFQNRGRGTCR